MQIETLVFSDTSRKGFLHKVFAWKPKKAKSFSLFFKKRYNYSVRTFKNNYFQFHVVYYSTEKEGKYTFKNPWDWKRFCMGRERYKFA